MTTAGMINYAHRGASAYAPENTFSAFYLGLALGADGIETDIRETSDRVLVLFHDGTMKRITGIDRPIRDFSYEELLQLDFGGHKGPEYVREKIVALDDFLKYFGGRPVHLALEIKQEGIEQAVLECVTRHGCAGQVIITSFSWQALESVRRFDPNIGLGFLTERIEDALLASMADRNIRQICPRASSLTAERVADAQARGFTVRAWGVRDPDLMERAVACGVDGMTLDFPDKLAALALAKGIRPPEMTPWRPGSLNIDTRSRVDP
ncbi:MAG: hypothetical protein EA426_02990 [Spirochaetaceae bacterium]|nr:MAG: hypothetical protein EA426_02990 [Spirochaetaceae bacterium]